MNSDVLEEGRRLEKKIGLYSNLRYLFEVGDECEERVCVKGRNEIPG